MIIVKQAFKQPFITSLPLHSWTMEDCSFLIDVIEPTSSEDSVRVGHLNRDIFIGSTYMDSRPTFVILRNPSTEEHRGVPLYVLEMVVVEVAHPLIRAVANFRAC